MDGWALHLKIGFVEFFFIHLNLFKNMNSLLNLFSKNYQHEKELFKTSFPLINLNFLNSQELSSLISFINSPLFINQLSLSEQQKILIYQQLMSYLPLCSLPNFNKINSNNNNFLANFSSINNSETTPQSTSSEITTTIDKKSKIKDFGIDEIKVRRLSYPREFKLIVLHSYWTNGKNKYRTCKEFHITKSMLNGWLSKAEKIQNSRPGSLKSGRSGRRPQFPKIENQLFQLFLAEEIKGEKVSNKWIRETARILAAKEEEKLKELELKNGFLKININSNNGQFSERWLHNFKKRFQIDWNFEDDQKINSVTKFSSKNLNSEELERIGREICSINGQLPIQVFYEKFHQIEQNITFQK